MKKLQLFPFFLLLVSCQQTQQNCKGFKTGNFKSEITINGVKKYTTSVRTDLMVIETYQGKTDTASIRWINDCEYILQKIKPKNMQERKAIDIKILTTEANSYVFEYGIVGNDKKQRGTATRITK